MDEAYKLWLLTSGPLGMHDTARMQQTLACDLAGAFLIIYYIIGYLTSTTPPVRLDAPGT